MNNDILFHMKDPETLEGEEKKRWTAVFVVMIVLFSVCCLEFLNLRYDSLARYPYKDENSRKLIRQYLTQEEIEYIIEYSIPPNMFIAYIQEDGFSIYHAAEYKELSQSQWDKSPSDIVRMVEETRNIMSVAELASYLQENNYKYDDVSRWIRMESEQGIELIPYAMNTDAYLNRQRSVSSRVPNVHELPEDIPSGSTSRIDISDDLQVPLRSLCSGISSAMNSARACAGLQISRGYVSYSDQESAHQAAEKEHGTDASYYMLPGGHDEHQLGLAVDFVIDGLDPAYFERTPQAKWLRENAWRYGLVQTRTEADTAITEHAAEDWHYRYVGTDLARTLHESELSFARYKAQVIATSNPEPGETSEPEMSQAPKN